MATPAHWVITSFGWRAALGAYVAAILMLVPWIWRVYPRRLAADVAVAPAAPGAMGALARTPAFWALMLLFTIAPHVGYLATVQHAVYFAALGYPAWEASLMLLIGGVLSMSGRVLAGLVGDRVGAPATGFLSFGMSLAGTLCLLGLELWPVRALAYGYVFFLFLPLGTRATIVSMLVPRIAPTRQVRDRVRLALCRQQPWHRHRPPAIRRALRRHRLLPADLHRRRRPHRHRHPRPDRVRARLRSVAGMGGPSGSVTKHRRRPASAKNPCPSRGTSSSRW